MEVLAAARPEGMIGKVPREIAWSSGRRQGSGRSAGVPNLIGVVR
jgi:hypothetical protein